MNEDKKEILEALADMYNQYCSRDGHLFMSAGESACEILERYGLLEADATGRGEIDYKKLDELK